MSNYSDFLEGGEQSLPIRLRWEKGTRYYEAHVEQDLWEGWTLTRIRGRRNSPLGQVRRSPCQSREDALAKLADVERSVSSIATAR